MIADALAGSVTFSDPISGADGDAPEPVPGESGEKARGSGAGRKRSAPRVSRPAPAAAGKRPANAAPSYRDVRDELLAYLEMAAFTGTLRCAECAAVLHEQAAPIADAMARYAMRSPVFLRILRQSATLKEALDLLKAVRPVVVQVRGHHFVPPPESPIGEGGNPDGFPHASSTATTTAGGFARFAPYTG